MIMFVKFRIWWFPYFSTSNILKALMLMIVSTKKGF